MWFDSLLLWREGTSGRRPGARRNSARVRRPFVPRLESLEARTVLSTLTVLNNLDKGAGSLRDAITNAKDGDTIVFAPGLAGQTITLTSDQLTLDKGLDIEGPGASLLAISGNDANRVFNLNEGLNVTINGLTITHGRAVGGNGNPGGTGGGGAILNVGSALSLANDVFSANVSLGNSDGPKGGAIANFGSGSLTVTDSSFLDNRADGRVKKGNFAEGGAIFSSRDGPSATITRCTFLGNQAIGGDGGVLPTGGFSVGDASGGALHVEGASSFTVTDSTFIGNQAIAGSGGSAPNGSNQGVYVVDTADGGAIAAHDGGTLVVSGSTFTNNQALGGANASGASIALGFVGSAEGGGLHCQGPTTITNCTLLGNQALGGSGNTAGSGSIFVGGGYGGAIESDAFFNNGVPLSISNSAFRGNQAVGGASNSGGVFAGDGLGGGIVGFTGVTATVTGSTFTGNQAAGGPGAAGGDGADGLGGGLGDLMGASLTVSGCALSGNQAVGGAGGLGGIGGNGFGGGLYNDGQSTLTALGSAITSNAATAGAAGVGGSTGLGEGGGAYFAPGGTGCLDVFTGLNLFGNTASTSDNNIHGSYTLCP
jgi:hypothetical protein